MKFVLVFIRRIKIFRNLFKVLLVVATIVIFAFMYSKVLTLLLFRKRSTTVRAYKYYWLSCIISFFKCKTTNFTLKLSFTTIVIVNIFMRCSTFRTFSFLRNGLTVPSLDGFYGLVIFVFVIS